MASIKVSDLAPLGTGLFFDSENYLPELQQVELASIHGGGTPASVTLCFLAAPLGFGFGYVMNELFG